MVTRSIPRWVIALRAFLISSSDRRHIRTFSADEIVEVKRGVGYALSGPRIPFAFEGVPKPLVN